MPDKILVAEDDPVALRNLDRFFTEEGYQVECASTGTQALRLLERHSFDLVISDISMPEMDGYQLLDQVRSRFRKTPIILMTGNFTLASPQPSRAADAYFLKPLNLDHLLQTTRDCLKKENRASQLSARESPGPSPSAKIERSRSTKSPK